MGKGTSDWLVVKYSIVKLTPCATRRALTALSAGRVALGITVLWAPRVPMRLWVGDVGDRRTSVVARAMGGRDLALGLGFLLADRHDEAVRGWVEAAVLADLTDAVATLAGWSALPRRGAGAVVALAAASAALGVVAARYVDRDR